MNNYVIKYQVTAYKKSFNPETGLIEEDFNSAVIDSGELFKAEKAKILDRALNNVAINALCEFGDIDDVGTIQKAESKQKGHVVYEAHEDDRIYFFEGYAYQSVND